MGYGGLHSHRTQNLSFALGRSSFLGAVSGLLKISVIGEDGQPLTDEQGNALPVTVEVDSPSEKAVYEVTGSGEVALNPKKLGNTMISITKVPDGYEIPDSIRIVVKSKEENSVTFIVKKSQVVEMAVLGGATALAAVAGLAIL